MSHSLHVQKAFEFTKYVYELKNHIRIRSIHAAKGHVLAECLYKCGGISTHNDESCKVGMNMAAVQGQNVLKCA